MTNRAAKYGDGLFETIRVSNRKILFAEAHFERLYNGMQVLQLDTSDFTFADFENILQQTLQVSSDVNLRIRITFFRTGEGLYTPKGHDFDFFVETTPLSSPIFELNKVGLQVGICPQVQLSTDILSNLKTISALPYVLAGLYKQKQGWDDCLLLNHRGDIAESIAANLFVYHNNTLLTPALSEGCIAGIMRKQLIAIALQQGIAVKETSITLFDLRQAEGLFLTNAIQGIQWIQSVADIKKSYYPTIAASLLAQLNQYIL